MINTTKEDLIRKIDFIRNTQIFTDPFPEQTFAASVNSFRFRRIFGWFTKYIIKKEISIWEAYYIGYNKAYEEIKSRLPNE